jgi:pyrroloquinoline-quinone synthase
MKPEAWSREEFLARLQKVGSQSYHHLHPFHIRMNAGELDQTGIQLWVANRFYYQKNIPLKDALRFKCDVLWVMLDGLLLTKNSG